MVPLLLGVFRSTLGFRSPTQVRHIAAVAENHAKGPSQLRVGNRHMTLAPNLRYYAAGEGLADFGDGIKKTPTLGWAEPMPFTKSFCGTNSLRPFIRYPPKFAAIFTEPTPAPLDSCPGPGGFEIVIRRFRGIWDRDTYPHQCSIHQPLNHLGLAATVYKIFTKRVSSSGIIPPALLWNQLRTA